MKRPDKVVELERVAMPDEQRKCSIETTEEPELDIISHGVEGSSGRRKEEDLGGSLGRLGAFGKAFLDVLANKALEFGQM
jgi:hypothetical protein